MAKRLTSTRMVERRIHGRRRHRPRMARVALMLFYLHVAFDEIPFLSGAARNDEHWRFTWHGLNPLKMSTWGKGYSLPVNIDRCPMGGHLAKCGDYVIDKWVHTISPPRNRP